MEKRVTLSQSVEAKTSTCSGAHEGDEVVMRTAPTTGPEHEDERVDPFGGSNVTIR